MMVNNWWGTSGSGDRGQLVLVAALALALVLVSLGVAYLQLGYHDDIEAGGNDPTQELEAALDQTVHDTTTDIPQEYDWSERASAADSVKEGVAETTETLETSRLSDGHVYQISRNESYAVQWTANNCPDDTDRQFGDCETIDGITVQERNDRTHVLAVAFDIEVTTPDRETTVTVAVERQGT